MLRVFEAFSGYGSQSIALRNLGIEHEVVAISEIDKYAIKAYEAIHGPTLNLGDISKIDVNDIPKHDLFTYSFPCQDLSVAGKQKGLGEGTRSGLLYECEKVIEHCRPKYLLLENVKNLVGKKFKADFDKWLEYLEGLGYTNYWKVLNAKHYGVPQNRERVFVVSILGEHEPFEWPTPIPLDKCIKDILEEQVDEKYYLSKELVNKFTKENDIKGQTNEKPILVGGIGRKNFGKQYRQGNRVYDSNGIAMSVMSQPVGNAGGNSYLYKVDKINQVGMLDIKGNEQVRRVYGSDGISPTLNTMQSGNRQPKIICEQRSDEGLRFFKDNVCDTIRTINSGGDKRVIEYKGKEIELPCIGASRGRNPENPSSRVVGEPTEQRLEINTNGTSNTITTVQKDNYAIQTDFKIRKLTPRECFRLMGMRDTDIDKIQEAGISNTQQYKLAGNSIVVDVLEAIFKNLFKGE